MMRPMSRLQTTGRLLGSLNRLQRAWDARWRQICDEADVHPSQAQALLYLADRGPMPMQDLSRGLCIAPSTATRIIEQMEKVSWVARSGDPDDRRRVLIHLLGPGEERAWELQSLGRSVLWRSTSQVGEARLPLDEFDRIADLLEAGQ